MQRAAHAGGPATGLAVLVVEGSALLRDRLVGLVAEVPGVGTATGVANLAQALARLAAAPVDAVVIDADDAGWPDLHALRALRAAAPGALLAVLTADRCPEECDRCAAAGADLCLSRSEDLGRVDGALRALAARGANAPVAAATRA